MSQSKVNIRNKKARFEYHLEDTFTAGMVLTGSGSNGSINNNSGYLK